MFFTLPPYHAVPKWQLTSPNKIHLTLLQLVSDDHFAHARGSLLTPTFGYALLKNGCFFKTPVNPETFLELSENHPSSVNRKLSTGIVFLLKY